ncbi:MAG: hypothetical protein AVDCRST_MAG59-2380 [uncultured Thermomicrobiales bacterium]|jgi:hypothetical protein|uniref:Uncharacterized protein n=1 Tax=uncultured Thermomicrobiales bacterium TaxID=1645740 RepID=A0A6J4UXN9_9BACT|nr:MAG: hypothetical protein AVDCRST_MAG59-2380 [uncultured Thermomicrobiales bacterium]
MHAVFLAPPGHGHINLPLAPAEHLVAGDVWEASTRWC